jgi:hypothetical protein
MKKFTFNFDEYTNFEISIGVNINGPNDYPF